MEYQKKHALHYSSNNGSAVHFLVVGIRLHEVSHDGENLGVVLGSLANYTQKLIQHYHSVLEHMSVSVLECLLSRKRYSRNGGIL